MTKLDVVLGFFRRHMWVLIVAALIIGFMQLRACQAARVAGAENRLQQSQTEAMTNSAQDAIATQGEAHERETQSEQLTKSNEREIRNAEGANDAVNPGVRDAGLRSLCRRAAYRDTERCRLFNARAAGVAPRR